MKVWQKFKESWSDFILRQHDEKATEDLEVLVNDDEAMAKFDTESTELPWQPYPVPRREEPAKREPEFREPEL